VTPCRPTPPAALLTLALLAGATASAAPTPADTEAQLGQVRARIHEVTAAVQSDVARRDSVAAALQAAAEALAAARSRVEDVKSRRAASEARRTQLHQDQLRTTRELDAERAALAAQLRTAYVGGPEEHLRVLLNAADPATLGRMLVYYGYLGEARTARIQAIQEQASRLETIDEALAAETARLTQLEEERQHEAAKLDAARQEHERALVELKARVASRSSELKDLKANAASLEDLLTRLRAALEDFDDQALLGPGSQRRPFEELRGRLPWPVHGTLAAHFGDPRPGGLKWNGLLLATRPGAEVRAPYYGRVVYADWLPGLGLLLIVEHGAGYLSLYGYNEHLYKAVGDRVRPGDVLAASPATGPTRPELYFEIRQGARPLDPRQWLKGSPKL